MGGCLQECICDCLITIQFEHTWIMKDIYRNCHLFQTLTCQTDSVEHAHFVSSVQLINSQETVTLAYVSMLIITFKIINTIIILKDIFFTVMRRSHTYTFYQRWQKYAIISLIIIDLVRNFAKAMLFTNASSCQTKHRPGFRPTNWVRFLPTWCRMWNEIGLMHRYI